MNDVTSLERKYTFTDAVNFRRNAATVMHLKLKFSGRLDLEWPWKVDKGSTRKGIDNFELYL